MWLLKNANGYTFDSNNARFDALVMDGNGIVAVGHGDDLALQFGSRATTVDMAGATVVPGLVDSHLHLAEVGKQAAQLVLGQLASKAELLQAVTKRAAALPDGAWILGGGWDENRWPDGLPTLTELDEAASGHPLLLTRVCYHIYMANTQAFMAAKLGRSPDNPSDGYYGRDDSGNVNGYVYENASAPLLQAVPKWSAKQWQAALRMGMDAALAAGLTAVHSDDSRSFGSFPDTWLAYCELLTGEQRFLRVHELVDWTFLEEAAAALPELPAATPWLEVGAAKLFADGSLGGSTAWLSQPYTHRPDWRGTPIYPLPELLHRVNVAHSKGFPVAIHAIGDAALDAALTALEQTVPIHRRNRVVHAELIRPDLLQRMAALGSSLAVDVQPRFVCSDFPWVTSRLGPQRSANIGAWWQMLEAQLHICGSSDAPIEPLQPLLGIHAAVTRKQPLAEGDGYHMAEALTPEEAIRLFSHGACYANHSEHHKGVIAPNWLADLTVLDRDIVHPRSEADIRDAQVLYTVVGGHFAYARETPVREFPA